MKNPHHRGTIRLLGYDYSRPGEYFVTICTHHRRCILGTVINGEMRLSVFGNIVHEEWLNTPRIRLYVQLGDFAIMPNHLHGILTIRGNLGMLPHAPTTFANMSPASLSSIIANFKANVTRRIRSIEGMSGTSVWQRGYFEHIIGPNDSFDQICAYIRQNVSRWHLDHENPEGSNATNEDMALFSGKLTEERGRETS
jgi:putative transposase